jgi:hypothetical protein
MANSTEEFDPYIRELLAFINEQSSLKDKSPIFVLSTLLTTVAAIGIWERKPGATDQELFKQLATMLERSMRHLLANGTLLGELNPKKMN